MSQERIPHQSFPAQVLTQCHNETARLEAEIAHLRQQLADLERLASDYAGVITVRDRELAEARAEVEQVSKREGSARALIVELKQQRIESDNQLAARDAEIEELNRLILSNQHSIAAQSAEVERLRGMVGRGINWLNEESKDNAKQEAELAALRERLEAAEKAVEAYRHYMKVQDMGWSVYVGQNGRNDGSPHAELFDALRDFSAGWLPPAAGTNNETKGG